MSRVFKSWKSQGKFLIIAEEDDLHSLLQAGADVESTEHCKKSKSTKNLVARLKEIRPLSFQPMGARGVTFWRFYFGKLSMGSISLGYQSFLVDKYIYAYH